MKTFIAITAAVALSACASGKPSTYVPPTKVLKPIDYADAGSTAVGMAVLGAGVAEANPLAAVAGDAGAPLVGLGIKYGIKKLMLHNGATECEADRAAGTGSAFGIGNNIAVIAGVAHPATLVAGAAAALAYRHAKTCAGPEYPVVGYTHSNGETEWYK